MNKTIAKVISTVLSPLVILALLPFLILYESSANLGTSLFWEAVSLVFLGIFSVFVMTGVYFGYFSDLDISKRKQRIALMSFGLMLTAIYLLILYLLNGPRILFIVTFGFMLGLWTAEIINQKFKLSIHVAAITGFASFLILAHGPQYLAVYFLVPLVAWARIKTKNHTLSQVIIGVSFALLLTLVIYIIFKM
ncbi:MAG: hypothetical protein COU25_00725 [Candidatus Levybacteria bacterium CG10_big_fil_rev_8_21_14_0_10_35_13]|nr:MAG: hypothetical protein COU25_00725 [Candidatus Levybacteria bacterium CG10_big_fil_rev_8_21_14_0_10_35_13]